MYNQIIVSLWNIKNSNGVSTVNITNYNNEKIIKS